jgi:hypothetical protein
MQKLDKLMDAVDSHLNSSEKDLEIYKHKDQMASVSLKQYKTRLLKLIGD